MAKDLFTGLTVRQRTVQWVCVKRTRDAVPAVDSRSAPLDPAGDSEPDPAMVAEKDYSALSSQLKTHCGHIKGPLSIGLSPEHVLLRMLEMPSTDPKELRNMVDLQADKLSPFPSENTIFSHEVFSRTDASSLIVVAITQKKIVDAMGSVFKGAGLLPHRLDVETLGWWRLLSDSGEIDKTGCFFIVLKDIAVCDIVAVRNGAPIAFRSAGKTVELTDADLCSELDYTMTTLEAERGIEQPTRLYLWHWGAEPAELKLAIHDKLGIEVELRSFESLPPLAEGLARRAATQEGEGVDLAPAEWLQAENRLLTKKRLILATAIMLAVWLAGVAGLFLGGRWQEKHIRNLQAKLVKLDAPSRKAREMRQLLVMTEQYTNRTCSAVECLREVTQFKPGDMEFNLFKYSAEKEKGRHVTIQGQAVSANSVLDFADSLEKSALFSGVRLTGPKTTGPDKNTFTITLGIREANE